MIEKVNPSHPDKVADRIAGALVDLAYKKSNAPKIAVEVLIGHDNCYIIAETSEHFSNIEVRNIIDRITNNEIGEFDYIEVPQDPELAKNQANEIRCGDNGIFKGVCTSPEEQELSSVIRALYDSFPTDGKFIYDLPSKTFIACQSNGTSDDIKESISESLTTDNVNITVNPLGDWTGGTDVDTGATNRKLGSDMGRAVTGGGLHGKDLSKADVSVNIACYLLAQKHQTEVNALCAIGDEAICFESNGETLVSMPYADVVEMSRGFINELGGFEKLAEWGLF